MNTYRGSDFCSSTIFIAAVHVSHNNVQIEQGLVPGTRMTAVQDGTKSHDTAVDCAALREQQRLHSILVRLPSVLVSVSGLLNW